MSFRSESMQKRRSCVMKWVDYYGAFTRKYPASFSSLSACQLTHQRLNELTWISNIKDATLCPVKILSIQKD